jgi:hypothetical protein
LRRATKEFSYSNARMRDAQAYFPYSSPRGNGPACSACSVFFPVLNLIALKLGFPFRVTIPQRLSLNPCRLPVPLRVAAVISPNEPRDGPLLILSECCTPTVFPSRSRSRHQPVALVSLPPERPADASPGACLRSGLFHCSLPQTDKPGLTGLGPDFHVARPNSLGVSKATSADGVCNHE